MLCGAVGSVVWGSVVDRAGARRPHATSCLRWRCCAWSRSCVLVPAFGATASRPVLSAPAQFALIALGGFLMTCTVGPVSAIVIDVVHPGVRATGASVLALFQNLFGLAAGPFITGVLSDALGLQSALTIMPAFGLLAAVCLHRSRRAATNPISLAHARRRSKSMVRRLLRPPEAHSHLT